MLCGCFLEAQGPARCYSLSPSKSRRWGMARSSPAPPNPLEGKLWYFAIKKINPVVPHPPSPPKALI